MQVLPDSNSIFLSHVLKRVRHRLMTHPPQSFMRNCLVAGAVAFIRGVASVSKNTSSKMLLNQSELLFLRANNIIKTSNFILLVLSVPCGPVGISACYLFICSFDCLRLETPLSFRTPSSFSFSFHSYVELLACQRLIDDNIGSKV